jgi:hypothetical protein
MSQDWATIAHALWCLHELVKNESILLLQKSLESGFTVDKTRRKILSALNSPPEKLHLLTTDKETSCLWVVPLGHINFNKLIRATPMDRVRSLVNESSTRLLAFDPTGWSITGCTGASILNSRTSGIFTVHGVPYSEHSSFPELVIVSNA